MKKLLTVLLLTATSMAFAGPHHGYNFRHYGHWHGGHNNWIAPAIVGGVVTYVLTRPQPAPVVIEQPSIVIQRQSICSEWKEVQAADGSIFRERTCSQ